jgi:hypothetical protein
MAESDWTIATDGLAQATLDRGVTNGVARPNGGGNFLYGFNSLAVATGATALFANQANFAPSAKGGSVRAAIKRGISGGPIGFSPFLIVGMQGPSVQDNAYLLGLSDDDPHRIVLRKGLVELGVPADPVGTGGMLKVSTGTFTNDTWLHIRIDMISNTNGDVLLQAFESDLTTNPVTAPVWTPVVGVENFVDDALGVNSGSAPFGGGRFGFGMQISDVTRRGYLDHIEVFRQL